MLTLNPNLVPSLKITRLTVKLMKRRRKTIIKRKTKKQSLKVRVRVRAEIRVRIKFLIVTLTVQSEYKRPTRKEKRIDAEEKEEMMISQGEF
jgi:hypothetical protein